MSKKRKYPLSKQSQITQQSQQSQQALAREVVAIVQQQFSGPLPPPEMLERYGEAVDGGAERIMVMAEQQSEHRRKLEARALQTDSRNSLLGVICAFLLGLATVAMGGIVVLKGHSWPGTVIGSAGLVGLVSVFIYGTKERRKERESKQKLSN
jgi:uncharacterized membrane protein